MPATLTSILLRDIPPKVLDIAIPFFHAYNSRSCSHP